jgi:hypothetical protein
MTMEMPNSITRIPADDYLVAVGAAPPEPFSALTEAECLPAFGGMAGQFVSLVHPHSEADKYALLIQFLAAFGNVIGRTAHQQAEADRHYCNLFVTLVGETSKGRKGSSWGHVRRLFEYVDEEWETRCQFFGLSTGEGLIHHLRDAREDSDGSGKGNDAGVADKRALVIASEFASILSVMQRPGNTLSPTLRDAWDRGVLRTMTKGSAERATGAHVSIIAHITREELRRNLTSTETANGFANRFLWLSVRRSKLLPEGGSLSEGDLLEFVVKVREAVRFARSVGLMKRDRDARALWGEIYRRLSDEPSGLLGAVTSRAEAQVLRLSSLYALLDRSDVVQRDHIAAADALWRYCEMSVSRIFGTATGDPVADAILAAAKNAGESGITQTDVQNMLSRHHSADRSRAAVESLLKTGELVIRKEPTGGRPTTRYVAT